MEPIDKAEKESRLWATFCHLSAMLGLVGVPFGHLLGPLIIWLIKRNDFEFVDDQGKEALNFQISMTIYTLVSLVLCIIIVGFFLLILLLALELIFVILASVKANEGQAYRYPLAIRFFR
jgi:uncharacterized Tic20 family protein